jgi:TIR domain
MRILEIDNGGAELAQGFVRAEWPQRASIASGSAMAWIQMFLRSASLWSQAKPVSAAVRIVIEPGRPVTTIHSFVVPKADEARLRLVLAAFMRTDQMGAGHTEGPQVGEDLAGRFVHAGEPRIGLVRETLHAMNGLAIHHNIRLSDQLPRLLQTFADLAIPFAYEFQAMPWTPPREQLKDMLHNVARLVDTRGFPGDLSRDQAALGERLKRATFNIEECLSAPSASFADAISGTLFNLLGETFYAQFDASPKIEPLDERSAQAFAYHVHSHVMFGESPTKMSDLTAAALREDADRCLSCLPLGFTSTGKPPSDPEPLALRLGPDGPTPPSSGSGGLKSPSSGGDSASPFLFISYSRADRERVYPVVDELAKTGATLWIDQHLIGGDDWVLELETRLMNCSGILAFVSAAFVASKYCGREIRFADALDKKIIPIFLDSVQLSGGMNFILTATQRVTIQGNNSVEILSAIKTHAPAAFRAL